MSSNYRYPEPSLDPPNDDMLGGRIDHEFSSFIADLRAAGKDYFDIIADCMVEGTPVTQQLIINAIGCNIQPDAAP